MHEQPLHCLQPAVAQCAAIARNDVVAQPHKAGIGMQPEPADCLFLRSMRSLLAAPSCRLQPAGPSSAAITAAET